MLHIRIGPSGIHGFNQNLKVPRFPIFQLPDNPALVAVKHPPECLSGNHIGKVLPVPIPNTEVKLFEPMIVHTSVKVGIAGF